MTYVKFMRTTVALPDGDETDELRLIIAGHAGYAERGRDIVCAAESILAQALACMLAGMEQAMLADFTVDGVADSGCLSIIAIPQVAGQERVRGAFVNTMTGFAILEKNYPAYVQVKLSGINPADYEK